MINTSYKSLLRVSLPVMFGAFVQFIVMFVDTAMLGRVGGSVSESSIVQSAAGQAGLIYTTFFMIFQGIAIGSQIIMASYNGRRAFGKVGKTLFNTLFLMLLGAVLLFVFFQHLLPLVIESTFKSQQISNNIQRFINIRSYGYFFSLSYIALTAFFIGTAKTKILLPTTLIVAGVNILLDYVLIYGISFFPKLGIEGAALASNIAEALGLIFLLIVFLLDKTKTQYRSVLKIDKLIIKETLHLSYPLMIQGGLALGAWTIFFSFIEQIGENEHTASILIRNFYYLSIIPEMAFGSTAKTYVSTLVAEKRYKSIFPTIRKLALLSVISAAIIIHGVWFYPEQLLSLINNDPDVIEITVPVMKVVSGSMLLLSAVFVFFSFVTGTKNTKSSLLIELVSVVIYLSVAYTLVSAKQSLLIVWLSDYLYFGLIGLFTFVFVKQFNWKKLIKSNEQKL